MRTATIALAIVFGFCCPAGAASAAQAPGAQSAIELVIDTSGSMNDDDVGGRVKKIDGAKVALLDFIDEVEVGTPVGLRTYPANAGDCNSGTVRQAIAPLRGGALSASVRGLAADGGTPTAEALRAAAGDLTKAGGGTLVLVSDGLSNCGDPCKVARDLVGKGVDFQAITVGFRIDSEGRKELQCIADAFDGQYVDARDSDALSDAVSDASRARLAVDLDSTSLTTTADAPVIVHGTIRNAGVVPARDVIARIRPADISANPGIRRPVQRLGNLDGNLSERAVTWTFQPGGATLPGPGETRTIDLDVIASAQNSTTPVSRRVTITITDATSAAAAGPIIKNRRLALLGDSYSAGEGANDYFPSTRTESNHCHRSRLTYLMPVLKLADQQLLACSGAVINDIYEADAGNHVKAQRDQLSDLQNAGKVDGVVLTMSGNDAQFRTLATSCLATTKPCNERVVTNLVGYVAASALDTPSYFDPLWSQSAEEFMTGTVENDVLRARLQDAIERLNSTLNNTAVVRRRGAIAPILVAAYPFVVPLTGRSCLPMFDLLSPSEMMYVTEFEAQLNAQVETATLRARQAGVPAWFVPQTEVAFVPDHTVCDGDPYARALNSFDGVDPRNTGQDILDEAGQQDLDDLLETRKNGEPVRGGSATAQAKGSALQAGALLAKAFVAGGLQEIAHPNVNGYAAETRAILRWSLSPDGRTAARDLASFKPVKLLPDWPSEDVNLGQLEQGKTPELQGGHSYPLTVPGLAPQTELQINMRSHRHLLATTLADANGVGRARVLLPPDTPPGRHTIEFDGVRSDGQPFHRASAVTVSRPFRWTTSWTLGAAAALALIVCLVATGGDRLRSRRQTAAAAR